MRGRPRKRPLPTAEEAAAEVQKRAAGAERKALRAALMNEEVGLQAGGMRAFETYKTNAAQKSRRPLGETGAENYKGIWLEWLMFLVGRGVGWRDAKPEVVADFLKTGLRPKSFARNSEAAVSKVTQARYARVLSEIYSAGLGEEDRHLSPVKLVDQGVPRSEAMDSMKLHGGIRWRLRLKMPAPKDEKSSRNRLVICLTLLEGMSCADVMGMELEDLLYQEGDTGEPAFGSEKASVEEMASWVRGFTGEADSGGQLLAPKVAPRGVHLRGARKAQDRRIAFRETTRRAMEAWLGYRPGARGAAQTKVVVLSLSRRVGTQGAGASYRTLFGVCADHIDEALKGSGLLTDEEIQRLAHVGPNTLRNACMLEWMASGLDLEEVRRRAGLKETRSLGRLAEKHGQGA